jgi:hypothetical protein
MVLIINIDLSSPAGKLRMKVIALQTSFCDNPQFDMKPHYNWNSLIQFLNTREGF